MPGVSFDRAASFYDQTRSYTEESADRVRDAIVAYTGATPATRFVELGIGTGRIALPFIRAGYDYTGIDISQAMMDRLVEKLAGAAGYRYRLHLGDITELPFADAAFDVAIMVHILHLVDDWQKALREARRVLAPGGCLLIAHGSRAGADTEPAPPERVTNKWMQIRRELGNDRPAGRSNIWGGDERVAAYLQSLGAQTERVRLTLVASPPISPRAVAERMKARSFSSDWETPDDLHAEAVRRLEQWMAAEIPQPDEPAAITGDFVALVARWP
jgi:SAM-dependent methyltransferase